VIANFREPEARRPDLRVVLLSAGVCRGRAGIRCGDLDESSPREQT